MRYLYKLKSNPAYTHTLDDSEDQKYEENERLVKPMGVQLRNLERRYMEEQKQIEEMNLTHEPPWMINNLVLCYMGERCNGSENERKQHFLQQLLTHTELTPITNNLQIPFS